MQILELSLYTHKLKEVKEFYSNTLELGIREVTGSTFMVKIGSTNLTFAETPDETYYHYAINIPSYQIAEAYEWLKKKTDVLPFKGDEIVDFKNWNAHAIYFYDPAGNIVELIARKNLDIPFEGAFNSDSFLHVSEIGLPVTDVQKTYDFLNQSCGLEKYSGDYSRFCATGNETGLFIIIDYQQKDWIPNQDLALPFPFKIKFNYNQIINNLVYMDEKLKLS